MLREESCWRRMARAFEAEFGSTLREWASRRVKRLIVGLRYAYVELEGGWCGIAATPYWASASPLPPPGHQATAWSLARLTEKGHVLAAALLVAAANAATSALIASKPTPWLRVGFKLADLVASEWGAKHVVMVGFMRGAALELARAGIRVDVVELDRGLAAEALRSGFRVVGGVEAEDALEQADAVIASGSILSDPCQGLSVIERAGRVVLVGPSSSFHPRIAGRLGVAAIAGVYVDWRVCPYLYEAVTLGGGPHTAERVYGVKLAKWIAVVEG